MKIALIGATGFVGSAVLEELLTCGYTVRALLRPSTAWTPRIGAEVHRVDVMDTAALTVALKGVDALVSAFNAGWLNPTLYDDFLHGSDSITAAARAAQVPRMLVVGGAGSLYVAPGVQLVDTPQFPPEWKPGALAAREALNRLRGVSDLDWTFISPPAHLDPGPRSGHYRVGGDQLLTDKQGHSGITVADFAMALVNELEIPRHRRQRFTVAY